MALTQETTLARLQDHFGDAILSHDVPYGFLTIEIPADRNLDVIGFLKNEADLAFVYLTDLCAVHMPDQQGREIGVVYHMHSLTNNVRLRLKCWIPEANPEIASATSLFAGANWMERETYDFFGVRFQGHPNLKRILNVDHMEMFPLLKQYPLEDSSREDKDDRFFGR
jgi:NADH-quinone oxidoreductase subunit C